MFTKWARWVILSTKAAVNTGSPKISCQRSKPKLVVMMVDFLPALSERWLNNNSAPFLSKIANLSFRGQGGAAYLKADATDGLLCPEACNAPHQGQRMKILKTKNSTLILTGFQHWWRLGFVKTSFFVVFVDN